MGLGTAGFQHSIALAPRNVQTDIAIAIAFERDRRSMLPIVTVGNRTIYYQVSGPLVAQPTRLRFGAMVVLFRAKRRRN